MPEKMPAHLVAQDDDRQFVSATEKSTWNGKASGTHAHAIADVTNLQTTLNGKAGSTHAHAIADVTNLQTTLNGKAGSTHAHAIADVTNLQTALDGKAGSTHAHAIADVTNLQTTLNGKAGSTHAHAIADVTNLQTTLNGKAGSTHAHAIADVTNLQTTLNGKAGSTHAHAITDVTNLQTTLNGKAGTAVATTAANGLMSSSDKTKLDGLTGGGGSVGGGVLVLAPGAEIYKRRDDELTITGFVFDGSYGSTDLLQYGFDEFSGAWWSGADPKLAAAFRIEAYGAVTVSVDVCADRSGSAGSVGACIFVNGVVAHDFITDGAVDVAYHTYTHAVSGLKPGDVIAVKITSGQAGQTTTAKNVRILITDLTEA